MVADTLLVADRRTRYSWPGSRRDEPRFEADHHKLHRFVPSHVLPHLIIIAHCTHAVRLSVCSLCWEIIKHGQNGRIGFPDARAMLDASPRITVHGRCACAVRACTLLRSAGRRGTISHCHFLTPVRRKRSSSFWEQIVVKSRPRGMLYVYVCMFRPTGIRSRSRCTRSPTTKEGRG